MKNKLKYMNREEIKEAIKNAKINLCSSFQTRFISEYLEDLEDNGDSICTKCSIVKPRKEMYYNPITGDIKCDDCFTEYCKPKTYKKNILGFLAKKVNWNVYPEDMQDYYKGDSCVKMAIT